MTRRRPSPDSLTPLIAETPAGVVLPAGVSSNADAEASDSVMPFAVVCGAIVLCTALWVSRGALFGSAATPPGALNETVTSSLTPIHDASAVPALQSVPGVSTHSPPENPPGVFTATDAHAAWRPGAAPLRRVADSDGPLDRLLSDELPHATASELDVWRDVLGDVGLRDAREIVRMRKHMGALSAGPAELLHPVPVPPTPSEPVADPPEPAAPDGQSAVQQAINVHRHNMLNCRTSGFLRLEPVLVEAAGGRGLRFLGHRVAADAAVADPTPSPDAAQVAAPAGHFIAVRDDNDVLLTRTARLVRSGGTNLLNVGGRLLSPAGDANEPLAAWKVASVGGLTPLGGCLYRPTEESGPATVTDAAVLTGHTVDSECDIDDEFEHLAELRKLQEVESL